MVKELEKEEIKVHFEEDFLKEKSIFGLNDSQISQRKKLKQVNVSKKKVTKSVTSILFTNIFTLFNAINIAIAIAIFLVKSYKDLFFILIIVINTLIGIYQELKARRLVKKLSLLNISYVNVIRNGKEEKIKVSELVKDDIFILVPGMQVPCDSNIIYGNVELNESLLTGESDTVFHRENDYILSGSIVVSGLSLAQVVNFGDLNYTSKIAQESKKLKKLNSDLLKSMKKVTFISTLSIIPLGIALFLEAYFLRTHDMQNIVVSTSASLLGMLPKGLVLLTSISLATGVIKLSKVKVLVQDLYSLETLSHVDVVCLDKTGTITTGEMSVDDVFKLNIETTLNKNNKDVKLSLLAYLEYIQDNNQTSKAIREYYKDEKSNMTDLSIYFDERINFNSDNKYGACHLKNQNKYFVLGAFDKLVELNKFKELKTKEKEINSLLKNGKRLLVCGYSYTKEKDKIAEFFVPEYLIVISDVIRNSAKETISYFEKEGVEVKIISGDNPFTVQSIAHKIGLKDAKVIDMSKIEEGYSLKDLVSEYTIFSRVTPLQKKEIVDALHQNGKRVAMTGDGINDLLALKEADCSIALSDGSDASKQVSQLVLLNSDFAALPNVLLEGRRVVNNVSRSAQVFFIKTIYSAILSIICLCFNIPFPFTPFMITIVDAAMEAFPSFVTVFDKSYQKVEKRFFPSVLSKAIPNAVTISIFIVILILINKIAPYALNYENMVFICYLVLAVITMKAVFISFVPLSKYRLCVGIVMVIGFFLALFVASKLHLLTLPNILSSNDDSLKILILMIVTSLPFSFLNTKLYQFVGNKIKYRKS